MRVLAVDDQALFLCTVQELIDATPGFELAGRATSGFQAIELAASSPPDLVLVDQRMPEPDGPETARRLHAQHPSAVIVLVSADELPDASACPGVTACLDKQKLSSRTLRQVWMTHGAFDARPAK